MIRKLAIGVAVLIVLGGILSVYLLSITKPFRISSLDSSFAIGADIAGRYRITEKAVEVYVISGLLRYQLPLRHLKVIDDISFLLAGESELNTFESHERSNKSTLDYPVAQGDQLAIFCRRFIIPIDESTELRERWLTFHIRSRTLNSPGRPLHVIGHCYAHSDREIFQQP